MKGTFAEEMLPKDDWGIDSVQTFNRQRTEYGKISSEGSISTTLRYIHRCQEGDLQQHTFRYTCKNFPM